MKTFMVLPLFLIFSQFISIHCKVYNKKNKFLIVVDEEETGSNKFKNDYPEYSKYQNYQFKKIPDPNNMLKFQPSEARSFFWKDKLTTSTTTKAPTTEIPETTTEMMATEAPSTTETPTETVPSVDYDLSNIPTNYPELLMFYKLCPVNITGKYNPNDVPQAQPIPSPPTDFSSNYFSQGQQQIEPSEISNQFPLEGSFNVDPFTKNYLSTYGSQIPNYLKTQNSYFGSKPYANQFSNGFKNSLTLSTANNGVQYGPLGEIAGYEQQNYGAGNSKYIPGYLKNSPQSYGKQQATIYLPPTFTSPSSSSDSQKMLNNMKNLYQNTGLKVIDLTMMNKNFQDPNGIRINRQLGIVANTKLSPTLISSASSLAPISGLKISNKIPQILNQFHSNIPKNYGYANLNNNLLYFGPTDKSNKIVTPPGTKVDFVNNQRPTLI